MSRPPGGGCPQQVAACWRFGSREAVEMGYNGVQCRISDESASRRRLPPTDRRRREFAAVGRRTPPTTHPPKRAAAAGVRVVRAAPARAGPARRGPGRPGSSRAGLNGAPASRCGRLSGLARMRPPAAGCQVGLTPSSLDAAFARQSGVRAAFRAVPGRPEAAPFPGRRAGAFPPSPVAWRRVPPLEFCREALIRVSST